MKKLSDEELTELLARVNELSAPFANTVNRIEHVVAELRELRALLATPMPCGWPEPAAEDVTTYRERAEKPRLMVAWDALGSDRIDPDDALALGAALVRAAIAAKEGAK